MIRRMWGAVALCSLAAVGTRFGFFSSGSSPKEISTIELQSLQQAHANATSSAQREGHQPPAADFVLVDVRSPREQGVSLIPGAITKERYEDNVKAYAGKTVIPYCTVGVRSEQYAKKLLAKGVEVLNYKESIIGWCKESLPLVTLDGQQTNVVHTASSQIAAPSGYKAVW